jgi:uncharacterized protein (DUF2147 family)
MRPIRNNPVGGDVSPRISTGTDTMAIRDRRLLRASALYVTATVAALSAAAATAQAADPSGIWLTADQSARIRVEHCPDGYWGSIAWEREPGVDAKNPDPSRRGKPLLGTPILIGMKPSEANKWAGKVYNPKEGSYYNISIILESQNKLRLEGCMLIFCGGETWTRVPDQGHATTGAGVGGPGGPAQTPSVCQQPAGPPSQRRQ